jgi:hypothetical protein
MLSYRLPVHGEKRGGIERAADTLAQGLAERGHHVVVFSHDERPEGASYEVRPLPWKGFVETWLGRRLTMGYLGNVLALIPRYRDFDVVVAHGDSLLLGLSGKPVLRVMHGSALGEAQSAPSRPSSSSARSTAASGDGSSSTCSATPYGPFIPRRRSPWWGRVARRAPA